MAVDHPPLIPREVLFGNPERVSPRLSPDGRRLAWIAPNAANVLQVWVKSIGKSDEKAVTADPKRGIRQFFWAENSKVLVYYQDQGGNENFQLHGVDLESGTVRDLTPIPNTRAGLVATNPDFPDEVLISLNERDRRFFDVHRLNVSTGERTLETENPGDVADWTADRKFRVRAAQVATPDGGTEIRLRESSSSPWKMWLQVGPEEILSFVSFSADGESAILVSSVGSDTARVIEKHIASGAEKVLAASAEVDAGPVVIQRRTRVVQAVGFAPDRRRWQVIDPSIQADFDAIAALGEGDFTVIDRDHEDAVWLVAFNSDRGPIRYYTWDRASKRGTFLFTHRSQLEGLALAEMKPVVIPSRDGLKLHSYLTLPVGVRPENLPLVLNVHGGPWSRDTWGFDPTVQWLANRGYAVLQVNFRSSTGYGKTFLNAGNKQWGLKMHDDLLDAVGWAVAQGIANPKKVAIYGGSYGGYAALAGVTFTPDTFACAVDIVGPSNLRTLIGSIPPYWKPIRSRFDVRMGNVDDPSDAELIRSASPLFKADRIQVPLLIGQGANDPRVNKAESEQIVQAIEQKKGSVTYVVYPDEGHGFARPENRLDFTARSEAFLAACLGGRAEPMQGERYPGSTAEVKVVRG